MSSRTTFGLAEVVSNVRDLDISADEVDDNFGFTSLPSPEDMDQVVSIPYSEVRHQAFTVHLATSNLGFELTICQLQQVRELATENIRASLEDAQILEAVAQNSMSYDWRF